MVDCFLVSKESCAEAEGRGGGPPNTRSPSSKDSPTQRTMSSIRYSTLRAGRGGRARGAFETCKIWSGKKRADTAAQGRAGAENGAKNAPGGCRSRKAVQNPRAGHRYRPRALRGCVFGRGREGRGVRYGVAGWLWAQVGAGRNIDAEGAAGIQFLQLRCGGDDKQLGRGGFGRERGAAANNSRDSRMAESDGGCAGRLDTDNSLSPPPPP